MEDDFFEDFDEGTLLKLDIFRECFKEWLPVFLHNKYIQKIYVFDFFAGPGYDKNQMPGSPIILLQEARGLNRINCKKILNNNLIFGFNDLEYSDKLRVNINNFIKNCLNTQCENKECILQYSIESEEFKHLFNSNKIKQIFSDRNFAKFVILDQFGFSQVDESVFRELVTSPTTDFIFFIASSFINRFKNHPNVKKYFETEKIKFDSGSTKFQHEQIANYFALLINDSNYFIHHFTIKKEYNNYGLIFGTKHTLGMEKFLKVCWQKDPLAGESNDNKYEDYPNNSLFYDPTNSNKLELVKHEIYDKVLNLEIKDNRTGLKYALERRCLPKIFVEVVKQLISEKKIEIIGKFNIQSSNIHSVDKYYINIL